MKKVNEYRFYDLGVKLEKCRGLMEPNNPFDMDVWLATHFAAEALGQLSQDPIALLVCQPAIDKARIAVSKVIPKSDEFSKKLEAAKPLGTDALMITSALNALEPLLEAECRTLNTYAVSKKGAYSTSDLIENAEIMLSEKTRKSLPNGVDSDIRSAGRALVFDLPTAAGFHMLRAIELTMGHLWTKTAGGGTKPSNWGKYIEHFKNVKVDARITDMLTSIRQLYRNPIAHPDETLSQDQAVELFGLGVSAIRQLVEGKLIHT